MNLWNHYYTPETVPDALRLLQQNVDAELVAGGTDLIIDMQQGVHPPADALVDVSRIPSLTQITEEDGYVLIGAAVSHTKIEESELVRRHGTALAESSGVVGGPQVRNVATIGGNVAHALPAADGTIGLLALNAEVQVGTLDGDHLSYDWQSLLSLFAGPGKNTLAHNQMITAFRFPVASGRQVSAFDRIMRPQGIALPILGVAANVTFADHSASVEQANIAIGPAGPTPFRATDAEAVLVAADELNDQAIEAAVAAAQAKVNLRTSKYRASKEYRHEMVAVLLRRVLRRIRDQEGVV